MFGLLKHFSLKTLEQGFIKLPIYMLFYQVCGCMYSVQLHCTRVQCRTLDKSLYTRYQKTKPCLTGHLVYTLQLCPVPVVYTCGAGVPGHPKAAGVDQLDILP